MHRFRRAGHRAGRRWPGARVIAVDDDAAALEYARRNAAGTAVELVAADVTAPGLLPELTGTVDLVVCNPPYIPAGAVLEPEVAEHDPAHALFGGPDGMAVIGPIAALAGRLAEAGWAAGDRARRHDVAADRRNHQRTGLFTAVTAHRDLAGRPRFVTARRTKEPA